MLSFQNRKRILNNNREIHMNNINTIGIDYRKKIFQVHGADKNGKTVLKKKLTRDQVLTFMANLPKCLVGMEACGGANCYFMYYFNHSYGTY